MTSIEDWLTSKDGPAARLRQLRTQAGLSGKQLAEALGWQPSKVSKIENGRQMPTAEDIAAWAGACGADADARQHITDLATEAQAAHRAFKVSMRTGQKAVQARYTELVANSAVIKHFETFYVPGLIQTPDYARGVLTDQRNLHRTPDDVDDSVAERMKRQQHLYDPGKRFEFLLDEPVLYRRMWSPEVMRAQLDRLIGMVGMPRVRFGIIPLHGEIRTAIQTSFQIYDDKAVIESNQGEAWYSGDATADQEKYLERLWLDAVEGDEARHLLAVARDRFAGVSGQA